MDFENILEISFHWCSLVLIIKQEYKYKKLEQKWLFYALILYFWCK